MGIILITHDFGVVANVCTKVAVMYLGQVIEQTDVESLFSKPMHPYTVGLINSVPKLDGDRTNDLPTIDGTVPSLSQVPTGCRFAPRCQFASEKCLESAPSLEEAESGHHVRCWNYDLVTEGVLQHAK